MLTQRPSNFPALSSTWSIPNHDEAFGCTPIPGEVRSRYAGKMPKVCTPINMLCSYLIPLSLALVGCPPLALALAGYFGKVLFEVFFLHFLEGLVLP